MPCSFWGRALHRGGCAPWYPRRRRAPPRRPIRFQGAGSAVDTRGACEGHPSGGKRPVQRPLESSRSVLGSLRRECPSWGPALSAPSSFFKVQAARL
eukprot:12352631-Alexandrium_andersonii.AAC.1